MNYDTDSPFQSELIEDTRRRSDGEQVMLVNGSPMGGAVWNLIVSKRDLTMWCKHGMKPHRHWKVSHVKKYFGIKGTGDKLLERFMVLFNDVMGDEV